LGGPRSLTVRFDDRHPAITQTEDATKARPQLSPAAGAAGNGDLKPATSLRPVSGGIETPGEPNSGRRPSNPAH